MNLNMTVGQVDCRQYCRLTQSTLAGLAESYRLLRVNQAKERVAVRG